MKTDREIRERLIVSGPERLSDAELLAVIMGEGTDMLSSVELAERILSEFQAGATGVPAASGAADTAGAATEDGSERGASALVRLASAGVQRIRRSASCGTVRAARIAAAAEFARRIAAGKEFSVDVIASKEDVVKLFAPLAELPHEEFWALYLTSGGRIIDRVRLSQGGVAGTVVDHKLIVKRAVELLAPSLILVHNHPSGVAAPSREDESITDTVRAAAALFDIDVVDHIIIARSGSYSFAVNG